MKIYKNQIKNLTKSMTELKEMLTLMAEHSANGKAFGLTLDEIQSIETDYQKLYDEQEQKEYREWFYTAPLEEVFDFKNKPEFKELEEELLKLYYHDLKVWEKRQEQEYKELLEIKFLKKLRENVEFKKAKKEMFINFTENWNEYRLNKVIELISEEIGQEAMWEYTKARLQFSEQFYKEDS